MIFTGKSFTWSESEPFAEEHSRETESIPKTDGFVPNPKPRKKFIRRLSK